MCDASTVPLTNFIFLHFLVHFRVPACSYVHFKEALIWQANRYLFLLFVSLFLERENLFKTQAHKTQNATL